MNLGNLPTPPPGSMSYPPASIPPTNNPISRPPSAPVTGPPTQPPRRASTPAPAALSSPSLSMMPPKRSGAMIAFVIVVDLALAAAGATLLVKGLAKPKPADAKPASAAPHAEVAAPTPAAVAVAPAAAVPEPVGSAAPEPPVVDKTVARDPKKKPAAKPDTKKKADGPVDPYGGAAPPVPGTDQSAEIEAQARESFGAFRRCFEDAIHAGPIHGDVRIAFVVQPDGHVDHAKPVVNTTGSEPLASCLAQTIGGWSFAPHSGAAASYERPFNYP